MKYFIAIRPMSECRVPRSAWIPVDAESIGDAKFAAENQPHGESDALWVGRLGKIGIVAVAVKDMGDWYGFFEDVPL